MTTVHRKTGMTLPEVLIACFIIGLTLSAFVTTFVMCQKSVTFANNRVMALHEARRVMETVMGLPYSDAALSTGTHTLTNGSYVVTESAGTKNITLNIVWNDPAFKTPSQVTLTTSMAQSIHK